MSESWDKYKLRFMSEVNSAHPTIIPLPKQTEPTQPSIHYTYTPSLNAQILIEMSHNPYFMAPADASRIQSAGVSSAPLSSPHPLTPTLLASNHRVSLDRVSLTHHRLEVETPFSANEPSPPPRPTPTLAMSLTAVVTRAEEVEEEVKAAEPEEGVVERAAAAVVAVVVVRIDSYPLSVPS